MGLPVPESLFSSYMTAHATTKTLVDALKTFGPKVTVLELVKAGILTEKLLVIGSMGAAFYVGAVIGSLLIATQKSLSGGKDLIEILNFASKEGFDFDELPGVLFNFPGIYDKSIAERWSYAQKASISGMTLTC